MIWIMKLNQFKRLKKGIGCINLEQLFHMTLMTEHGINVELISMLILLLTFYLCQGNIMGLIMVKIKKVFRLFYNNSSYRGFLKMF